MIKALFRFSLLLVLCSLFVYAPEILSAVSAPYSLSAPERVLLRIAVCCDNETSVRLNKTISAYQRDYPAVHLRVTRIVEHQLSQISFPYPDVIVCPVPISVQLPSGFIPAAGDQNLLCAISPDSASPKAVSEFAAYIIEASAPQSSGPEI